VELLATRDNASLAELKECYRKGEDIIKTGISHFLTHLVIAISYKLAHFCLQ